MQIFSEPIVAALSRVTGIPAAQLKLERPKDAKLGDLAFPCFVVAKERAQSTRVHHRKQSHRERKKRDEDRGKPSKARHLATVGTRA